MMERYIEQILNIYNHVDSVILTDDKGIIEYYITYRPDINRKNRAANLIGKHVLEAWSSLTEETSTILKVLATGEPSINEIQEFPYDSDEITSSNNTFPIKDGNGKLIGCVCTVTYLQKPYERKAVTIDIKKKDDFSTVYSLDSIKGCSESTAFLKEKIRLVAETDSSVLIYGETGVGKELVAQAIHGCSKRKKKRFVSQNCAAIPENLLESILFGTVKGAYTGAENREGFFEVAKGGTLFLDEINSMELGMQAKILKAIEEKEVIRVGSTQPIPTDVRIVTAMNENPMECVRSGKLRRDLFHRISIAQIDIEPLRDRRQDIQYLTNYYIHHYNEKMNRTIIDVDDEVKEIFDVYDWPGNVRELKNVLEGAFNFATTRKIEKKYLPSYMIEETWPEELLKPHTREWGGGEDFSLSEAVAEYEKNIILRAIENSKNLAEAARKLGISPQHLNYKLKRYKI